MNPVLSIALLALSLLPAPRQYYVKYAFRPPLQSVSREEIVIPLDSGLFADSLIVRGVQRQFSRDRQAVDTSSSANRTETMLMVIDVAAESSSVRLVLSLKNVLAQPVVNAETVNATRAGLDTALFEAGRRMARQLTAKRR